MLLFKSLQTIPQPADEVGVQGSGFRVQDRHSPLGHAYVEPGVPHVLLPGCRAGCSEAGLHPNPSLQGCRAHSCSSSLSRLAMPSCAVGDRAETMLDCPAVPG